METILIEWISEKHGVNYFTSPLMIQDREAKLIDYIQLITELEHPKWMVTSERAHFIRQQRNLVHAKLCMDTKNEINQETCEKVLRYLNEIIDSYFKSKL